MKKISFKLAMATTVLAIAALALTFVPIFSLSAYACSLETCPCDGYDPGGDGGDGPTPPPILCYKDPVPKQSSMVIDCATCQFKPNSGENVNAGTSLCNP